MKEILKQRDRILESILDGFSENPVLNTTLVLQGGGALHFSYGSPRYSADLDFVFSSEETDIGTIKREIAKGIMLRGLQVYPKIKMTEGNIKMLRATYPQEKNSPSGKLEIAIVPSFDHEPSRGKYSPLLIESPSEIYADKIIANVYRINTRNSIKGTDLFDLNYLASNFQINTDKELLQRKALSYKAPSLLNSASLGKIIEYIEKEEGRNKIIENTKRTLLPDVADNIRMDEGYFEKAKEHFRRFI